LAPTLHELRSTIQDLITMHRGLPLKAEFLMKQLYDVYRLDFSKELDLIAGIQDSLIGNSTSIIPPPSARREPTFSKPPASRKSR
jgi:hypothetical protein